jgi:hypothetical protein
MILLEKLHIPYEKIKWDDLVFVRCDYCGDEVEKRKCKIQKGRKLIQKDSCIKDACTKKKLAEINLLKYGVANPFQRKDIQEKIKKTNLKKHGVEYAQQNESIRKKSEKTCLKNHGVKHALQNKKILKKAQDKSLEKYGTKFPIQLEEFKQKVRTTNLERHGIEDFLSSKEIQKRIKETNIQKYGSPFPIKKFGKTQESIKNWLNEYGFNFKSDYKILEGKELDLYDEEKKLAIEYCGIYWHNENSPEPRDRNYHHEKYKKCKEQEIRLLTIFDDEWNNKQDIIKSTILSKLGIFSNRIYARKCEIKQIEKKEFNRFCEQNHIQGKNSLSLVCFGLFYKNELVAAVDLGRHHRKKDKGILVLTRLCFKLGHQIIGGSSKLFKFCVDYCKENKIKNIISWSDNRWSDGNIYKNLGFNLDSQTRPDYSYVNMSNPKKRISKQSQKKNSTECPKGMTEKEWADTRGLSRIWDCGKTRWIFNVRQEL